MNALLILGALLLGIFLAECCYQIEERWKARRRRIRGICWLHRIKEHEIRRAR